MSKDKKRSPLSNGPDWAPDRGSWVLWEDGSVTSLDGTKTPSDNSGCLLYALPTVLAILALVAGVAGKV